MGDHEEWIAEFNERDRAKLAVLVRSFATPEDLQHFISTTQQVHKEQEHRAWAWKLLIKLATAVVLLAGAFAAVRNGWSNLQDFLGSGMKPPGGGSP